MKRGLRVVYIPHYLLVNLLLSKFYIDIELIIYDLKQLCI